MNTPVISDPLEIDIETFSRLRDHGSAGTVVSGKFMGGNHVEVAAEGALVRRSDGTEVLDFGSFGVALLGHRHPAVIHAVEKQLHAMPIATRSLANPIVAQLMARLAGLSGNRLQRVWLGSDGADAVELALKLARRASGRLRVLAVEGAFHGKTLGALAATWNPSLKSGLGGVLPYVTHLARDDPNAVEREMSRGDVAALLFEPILGEGGVRPIEPEVLRKWCDDAHAGAAFVIADEVQSGCGRCGPSSLASSWGLPIDAMLLGKSLGGGVMPVAAIIASDELFAPLARDAAWHSSTFGGNPLSCAAALAALDAIAELAPRGAELGDQLARRLGALQNSYPDLLVDLRGRHLFWGIELCDAAAAGELLLYLAEGGLLVSPCLSSPSTLRLLPPLVLSDAQLESAMAILGHALNALRTQRRT